MTTRIPAALANIGFLAALSAASAAPTSPTPDAETGDAARTIRFTEGFSATRARDASRERLMLEDGSSGPGALVTKPKGSVSSLDTVLGGEFWIYDASTELLFDDDGDGYYHSLRVRFDADTLFIDAYVYAELYLSWDGETWERYFVTEDFLIEGSTSIDEYEVETEFVAGYPTGLYDVLIELYDADFGEYVGEFGPLQSSGFSLLPIEDLEHDGVPPPALTIVHEHGGSGSTSWPGLGLLVAAFVARRIRRR